MTRKMVRMCAGGDVPVAEWDTETVTDERIREIEHEFKTRVAEGYFAADVDKREIIKQFDPSVNTVLIPKVQGGGE